MALFITLYNVIRKIYYFDIMISVANIRRVSIHLKAIGDKKRERRREEETREDKLTYMGTRFFVCF